MIHTLPPALRSSFATFRAELNELYAMGRENRPVSVHLLREYLAYLPHLVNALEEDVLNALNADPDYDPSPWSGEDTVILTAFRPESEVS